MESANGNMLSHGQARSQLLSALTDPNKRSLPYDVIEYIECFDDEMTTAAVNWLKRQNERSWVIDTRIFVPVMNKSPMTRILYEAYNYILSSYDFDSIPRSFYDPTTIMDKALDISKALNKFRFYKLTGFQGEVAWEKITSVFCGISGDKIWSLSIPETDASHCLREQIEEAYHNGYRVFVTSGDIGVGCLAGEQVIEMRETHPDCKLLLVTPIITYKVTKETEKYYRISPDSRKYVEVPEEVREGRRWEPRIDHLMKTADMKYFVEFPLWSTPEHYEARDQWIIDHCGKMIVLSSDFIETQ